MLVNNQPGSSTKRESRQSLGTRCMTDVKQSGLGLGEGKYQKETTPKAEFLGFF
ncbi:hypothetical protein sync_1624 [Synechococcus sp. CC9311]|nr:hypothetical protein sync_1624 [Synechococcus sp. CC9311]